MILLVLELSSQSILAQDQRVADSLKAVGFENIESDSTRVRILNDIAYNSLNADSSLYYSNLLIEYSTEIKNNYGLYHGFLQRGHVFRLKGNYYEAIQDYFSSLNYTDEDVLKGMSYVALGDVYSITGSHNNSVQYYNQAVETLRLLDSEVAVRNLASALINLGDELFNASKLDSALSCFEESLAISERHNLLAAKAYTLGNMGLVFASLGDNEVAEERIHEATAILKLLGDTYPISVYYTYMADIYIKKGDSKAALEYAFESLEIAEEEGLKEQVRDASLKLSELFEAEKDFVKAYKFHKQYVSFRDSLNNEQVIQQIADLRTEFEVSQKQAEVDLLTAERKTQRVIGFSLMGGLILVLALAIIQYRNNIQKKRTNTILREQKSKLEELNQTKDRFFSIISHDLRGPVNAFHGVSRMIKFFVQQKQMGQLEELAEDIDQSVDRLSSLLDNLLNWAVQQQGNFPYVPEKLDIHVMADDLVKTFATMATSKNIALIAEVAAGTEAWADRNTTMTIIRNLVSNALKFTPQEGEVKIKADLDDESILIQVQDNGVGIPADKLNDLFKLQARKSTWGTDGEKGLGLGLQLVYDFVTLNKGKINVDSTPNQGTTFSVWLPVFEEVVVPENA